MNIILKKNKELKYNKKNKNNKKELII